MKKLDSDSHDYCSSVCRVVRLFTVFGQSKKPIKIGMVADKTGGLAAYGYSHEKAVRAAMSKINKEGGMQDGLLSFTWRTRRANLLSGP